MAVAKGALALRVVESPDAWQRAWRGFERSLRADSAVKSTRTIRLHPISVEHIAMSVRDSDWACDVLAENDPAREPATTE